MNIRYQTIEDDAPIEEITLRAFQGKPYSSGTEQYISRKLRDNGDLSISLVCEKNGKIVGHVAASKCFINGKFLNSYVIGPLAVSPDEQGKGVGTQLMNKVCSELQGLSADISILVGDPNFYSRVGFTIEKVLTCPSVPAQYFQSNYHSEIELAGTVTFSPVFDE